MKIIKKIRLSKEEVKRIKLELGNYIWVVLDARRGIMAAGDEYIADLRDHLLQRRCRAEDIVGLGVDLITGELDYHASLNRRNPAIAASGIIPAKLQQRTETLIHYFFEAFAPFRRPRVAPQYSYCPPIFANA